MRGMLYWAGLCLLLFVGCATWTGVPRLPKASSVVRDQLVVYSEFPLPAQHRLLDDLVNQRDEISRKLALPTSDEPIYVYLFDTSRKYKKFVRKNFPDFPVRRAFFVETDTRLSVYAQWGERIAEDLRHEVAHGYLHASLANLPLWLDEGLAEYFEIPSGRQGLNRPHYEALLREHSRGSWTPGLESLEQLVSAAEMSSMHYAESWAWVHFLLETTLQRRQLLQNYLTSLKTESQNATLWQELRRIEPRPQAALLRHLESLE